MITVQAHTKGQRPQPKARTPACPRDPGCCIMGVEDYHGKP